MRSSPTCNTGASVLEPEPHPGHCPLLSPSHPIPSGIKPQSEFFKLEGAQFQKGGRRPPVLDVALTGFVAGAGSSDRP